VGVAFVVGRKGAAADADELGRFLARRLAKYKTPKEFIFVESLPRNPYGKVIKAEVRRSFSTGDLTPPLR
jgi:fatty-acyl-CoA synthase